LRKYASIFLLLILLFNMVGYRAWFYYAERKSDVAMESRLDMNQYDESELLSLTIPLNNPYQIEQTRFERINGEINFQGKTYKLVKRKVTEGNLVILCVPDIRKMILKKAKTEFGNGASGLTSSSKNSSGSQTQKNFGGSDYLKQFANLEIGKFENVIVVYHSHHQIYFSDPQIDAAVKPPQHWS
jgi:cbb3-type cytochrome oxidase subunit 3